MTFLSGPRSLIRRPPRGWMAGLAAVLLAAAMTGCGAAGNPQASTRNAQETATAPTTISVTTTTVPPTTPTPSTTEPPPTEPPPTESSTGRFVIDAGGVPVEPPVCVDSFDPRCGPFRWEPTPTNQPAHIDSVVVDPPRPIVGQDVTVTVQWSDPDADTFVGPLTICDGQGPCVVASVAAPACHGAAAYGPWTVPPPGSGAGTFLHHFQFAAAGTFTWSLGGITESSVIDGYARDRAACVSGDPYGSDLGVTGSITVLPEFPSIPG